MAQKKCMKQVLLKCQDKCKNETTINADDEHTTVQKKHTDFLPN